MTNKYKSVLVTFILLTSLVTTTVYAADFSFERNLSWGMQDSDQVRQLQEFLTEQEVYSGPINGNFYSLTYRGVRAFQQKYDINPVSGYFGPMSRTQANALLVANTPAAVSSNVVASEPTTTAAVSLETLQARVNAAFEQTTELQKRFSQYKKPRATTTVPTNPSDTTPPVISGLSNDITVRKSKTWSWNSESGATFRFLIDTTSNSSPSGSFSSVTTATRSTGTGTYYLHVQARDTAGNTSGTITVSVVLDNTAPVLSQITAVPLTGTNTTPSYTFKSTEKGTITYAGDCTSGTSSAISGNNTIVFSTLAVGTHSNCTIRVTDVLGNRSNALAVSSFIITGLSGTSTPPPSPQVGEIYLNAYTTAYTYYDNTPPGSADISHPIIHQKAGGTGTYADPITIAVGHSIISGQDILDYPAGTKFYIPNVRRYFIVEDTCGDGNTPQNGPCHTGFPSGTTTWLDMWIDGQSGTNAQADNCASAVTDLNGEVHVAIKNPASNYRVVAGPVFQNGSCTQQYGNTAVTQ
ncbi:MAG: hypothetical protein A2664_04865 [Candidatus Taylorbacteria bacterium RIFCSPHIGHO2_01_FULL_46_22b]|uniref:Cadherin domain-containing protein n=1 Tax=Candidatus Taylorbacteria bacterium RIFCSPHIGHO2_01_FULL_46_22b TaxID=1802301 RepID=A0A1G2M4M2_9BACT|nr:MAG: hypothetical protein A2664_04865 [Candidatus Taylorbacteria bacterium RIFCSPHIGHO2_01_FULL_46_22b]